MSTEATSDMGYPWPAGCTCFMPRPQTAGFVGRLGCRFLFLFYPNGVIRQSRSLEQEAPFPFRLPYLKQEALFPFYLLVHLSRSIMEPTSTYSSIKICLRNHLKCYCIGGSILKFVLTQLSYVSKCVQHFPTWLCCVIPSGRRFQSFRKGELFRLRVSAPSTTFYCRVRGDPSLKLVVVQSRACSRSQR